MSKEKIRIKPPHAMGSLVQRAVIVSLCLLVVPLFLHSLFLYRSEYQDTLDDVRENLTLTARAQKAILEERLGLQWQILDAAAASDSAFARTFKIIDITPPANAPEHFVKISQNSLLAGKVASQSSAIALSSSIDEVFDQLTDFEKSAYPLSLSFIDKNGKALAGAKQETALSLSLPIDGADFLLYLSIPEGAIERLHKEWYVYHFLSLLFFVGVIGGLIVYFITRRIARPLHELCKAMERVGEGAVHVRYVPDKMGFEINELGKQFNQTLDQVLEHSQEAERQRIARERLAEELKIGHDIQASLLPTHLPELKDLDIAAGFLPAREVGGDFYDLFPMEGGKFLIAIADTAGKGISACLYSLGLRSMLRTLASKSEETLSEIVLRANDLFWKDAQHSAMFVTLWIGIYYPQTRALEYCSQGHPPAYLLRCGECIELWTPGIALGAQAFDTVTTKKLFLQQGDLLFLYTDGVIEAHDPDNRLFGQQRLKEFLQESVKLHCSKLIGNLLKKLELFGADAPQHDDTTLLAIKVLEPK